jgi:succinyl-CoA synthetase beta subunit
VQARHAPASHDSVPTTPLPDGLPRVLTEHRAKVLLEPYGLPGSRERLATSAADAVEAAEALGYPVVLKMASPDLPHKTEAGGVVLGLQTPDAVAATYDRIIASARHYKADADIDGVLVQKMAPRGHELVIGMVNDATFGPIMMVGLGGTIIELMGDVVHRPAPVDAEEAAEMLLSLKSAKLLQGFRGAPAIDIAPAAELIANVSRAALAHREQIAEMEFNPVILHADGSGLTIADALILLKDPSP